VARSLIVDAERRSPGRASFAVHSPRHMHAIYNFDAPHAKEVLCK